MFYSKGPIAGVKKGRNFQNFVSRWLRERPGWIEPKSAFLFHPTFYFIFLKINEIGIKLGELGHPKWNEILNFFIFFQIFFLHWSDMFLRCNALYQNNFQKKTEIWGPGTPKNGIFKFWVFFANVFFHWVNV